jgi:hypothetical protein
VARSPDAFAAKGPRLALAGMPGAVVAVFSLAYLDLRREQARALDDSTVRVLWPVAREANDLRHEVECRELRMAVPDRERVIEGEREIAIAPRVMKEAQPHLL